MSRYLVAITGASGAIYGVRLVDELLAAGHDVELMVSQAGFLLLREELRLLCTDENAAEEIRGFIDESRAVRSGEAGTGRKKTFLGKSASEGKLTYSPAEDLTSDAASGSSLLRAMVICPCSMGTLSRVSMGNSGNLIERAADCVLKERGMLVLVPRETPLTAVHLENMLRLTNMGAVVLPAMPAFYTRPATIDDMVAFVVGKTLDLLGVENNLYLGWVGWGGRDWV
jgi:4-hydroxy-3-polyprenylbenzoate decarboxylase